MSAIEVIKELEELPSQEREKVLRWLQQQGLKDLWARADALMKDAPKLNEDESRLARQAGVQFMHRKPLMIDGWWLIVES